MNFEKEYYEHENFWSGQMLQDPQNQMRIEFTSSWVPSEVSSLIDVGCGNGVFLNFLNSKRKFDRIVGVDRSENALKYVNVEKCSGDISSLPFKDNEFDCVTCLEVIEHLPVPIYEVSIAELARISSKYVIISVPFDEQIEESYNRCPSCLSIFNKELHLRRYTESTIQSLMVKFGFKCVKTSKLGESVHYKGHYAFRKMFYKEQFLLWDSPVCPICGFKEENTLDSQQQNLVSGNTNQTSSVKQKIISSLSKLPKMFWPKERKFYWIIGLYEKV